MYLKRLESVGFKSFAERIKVDFVPGMTAVVGPNGSGKSNITDAIRWVLGEQSVKSLRGDRMEDIIFQGSDSRNPLNVAEVVLVLDNSDQVLPLDYKEVSVTRRIYRSGASEFYINKQSCRLKDIIDLFMDSGLGREAFSIISQGKVEEVLSSKAEERRVIFEEAAGVLKYKQRKKKAEYKLTETNENLNRVEDIIFEIEQQIKPLHEQAQVAKKYVAQRDLLKQQEISLLITEIEHLHEQWRGLLLELDHKKMDEIHLKTKIQQKEAEQESDRQAIQQLDNAIEQLQTDLLTTTQQLEQYEGKKQVLHERLKHFSENKEKLEQQKERASHWIEKQTDELSKEKNKLAEMQTNRLATKEKLKKANVKLTLKKENIADQIEELKAEYIENLNIQAAKRNERQSIQEQSQQIGIKSGRQAEKLQELLILQAKLEEKKANISAVYSKHQKTYTKKEEQVREWKKKLGNERNRHSESQKDLYTGYQTIARLKSRKDMLEEMKADFQGFFHGVKAILKAKKNRKLKNIHGAVIELIDIPPLYLESMETILGGQAQHIVVDGDKEAREAISWLKQTNNGRATFLPLESIQSRFLAENLKRKIENHPGFIGVASDLVKTDSMYQKVINYLMGHVVVVKTLKDANEIATLVKRRHRIVTLDGDVVNPGGSMSGGAKKKTNQSLFTREKDLQEMTNKLSTFTKKAATFERKVDEQKQYIKHLEEELEAKERSLITRQQELQDILAEYRESEMELVSLHDNISLYDQDNQQYKQDSDALHTRSNLLANELSKMEQKLAAMQENIDDLVKQETEFQESREQIKHDLHHFEISLAEQDERVRHQQEKVMTIEKQLNETTEQYQTHIEDLNNLHDLQNTEESEIEIDQQIHSKKQKTEVLTIKIQEKRSKRLQDTQSMEDQERELKEEHKQHQLAVQAIQQKEVKANRLDVDLENRLEKLQSEYTITYEMAKQNYKKVSNIDEAKRHVTQLKQTMKQLGTVNLGAIEEYERILERYTFLTNQKADLVQAKQTLYSIISEMDEVMKTRFEETFSQIKDEFTIVFGELFGGGRAELKLTDPSNLLDTGIDIIAQPPGKNLQHLGLLSGGERALTAIALLFSILRVRPVPFCVLDEVEAALDEANVDRFAKYLKMHSDDTQFIVITHRKGTMEQADVLYGVTMQEPGVSRLVSVQLEDRWKVVNV